MFRSMEPATSKRPRLMDEDEPNLEEEPRWDDARFHDDIFSRSSIFIPLEPQLLTSGAWANVGAAKYWPRPGINGTKSRKRARDPVDDPDRSGIQFPPEMVPRVPILEERRVEEIDEKSNPFCDANGSLSAHPRTVAWSLTKYSSNKLPSQAAVNGLVKFRLWNTDGSGESVPAAKAPKKLYIPGNSSKQNPDTLVSTILDPNNQGVNHLPPGFGKSLMLKPEDQKLFDFYRCAICSGRTLLDKENIHLLEIAPMADKSKGVCHAVLSLASAYLLDYWPSPSFAVRANYHYQESIKWLTEELKNTQNYEPGKEEALVTTLSLLIHNEIVCWEPTEENLVPAWYRAARLARRVLDTSDPGYNYKRRRNVQESKARHRIGNEIAFCEILSSAFAPVEEEDLRGRCPYSWLMSGTETEVTKIEGNTGMCAKVLYTLARITYMTGMFAKNPCKTEVWPTFAGKIRTELERVRQWSDLSEGYSHAQELLDACILDENGLVKTKEEATDLTAQTYIQAALIYLECRFFRRTPYHPSVRRNLDYLIKCFDRCPTSGDLYTAQTPVFGVAIAGVVATTEKERDFCRKYVRGTCTAGERGNLATLDNTLEFIWKWMDENRPKQEEDDADLLDRRQWWEELVTAFYTAKNRRDFA
ncbi:hypothetical protein EYR41_010193 [Orbilia oligospora]|uniref:Transcription factor domain-containing protein n=1 Tax=Orbilia oligospora TaxID=2813651 RepID=A0A8H2DNZ5_ORBOL|nr:hypothetical protein EYR41_010193 [Orbilia oligospora]